jgi:hypothetical protein
VPVAVNELLITGAVTLEDAFVTMMLSKKARLAVVARVIVVAAVPAEKRSTLFSKIRVLPSFFDPRYAT